MTIDDANLILISDRDRSSKPMKYLNINWNIWRHKMKLKFDTMVLISDSDSI